jgi:EmrB/QacA subfamily drug resistance transporter
MASTILASSMGFIDGTALNVALPSLQESLGAKGTDLFWILNAYLLMISSLILIGGSLGDKLGRKRIFVTGICLFVLGSVACGFSPSVPLLIGFRAFQGVGGALMIPGSLSIISTSINPEEEGKAIGTWSAATMIVTVGGPILGGWLADAGIWRYIFFINVPIGAITLAILFLKVKVNESDVKDKSIDFRGAICIALGLASLTYGCLRLPITGFEHISIYLSLGAGVLFLVAFFWLEATTAHPMMPLKLFASKQFSGTNLLTFFLYGGLGAGMLFLSLNTIQIQGYTQLQAGLTLLPFTFIMIALSRLAGKLSDKYGPRLFLTTGPLISATGLLLLSFVGLTSGPAAYWTTFFPGIAVFAVGMSMTVAPLTATVMASVSAEFSGVASGVNNAMTRLANVFSNAILGGLAVVYFISALHTNIDSLKLAPAQQQAVMAQAPNLGDAKVPQSITDASQKTAIQKAYKESFIVGYDRIMRIASALAVLGGMIGWVTIRNGKKPHPDGPIN